MGIILRFFGMPQHFILDFVKVFSYGILGYEYRCNFRQLWRHCMKVSLDVLRFLEISWKMAGYMSFNLGMTALPLTKIEQRIPSSKFHDLYGGFHDAMGVPNGWFISCKIPCRNGWFGGTSILGNLHKKERLTRLTKRSKLITYQCWLGIYSV